jgi:hypothetical protein
MSVSRASTEQGEEIMKLLCHSSVLHKYSIVFYLKEKEVSACDFIRDVI